MIGAIEKLVVMPRHSKAQGKYLNRYICWVSYMCPVKINKQKLNIYIKHSLIMYLLPRLSS